MKKILIAVFIILSFTAKAQTISLTDTAFRYDILFVEKQTIIKDIDNSIINGNYFTDMLIVCNNSDTVKFKYDYPFLILSKDHFYKLKRFSGKQNSMYLFFKYKNDVKEFLFKMPFEIFFDGYSLLMSHNSLRSKSFQCTVSSVSYALNTGNKSFVQGIDISIINK